jgi:hypothetical protein
LGSPFLFLYFDDDDVDVGRTDVFDGVRWIGCRPDYAGTGCVLTAVEFNVSIGVASNHIGAAEDVLHSGPAMRVNGDECARWDDDVENADVLVLENESMEVGRGDECVE